MAFIAAEKPTHGSGVTMSAEHHRSLYRTLAVFALAAIIFSTSLRWLWQFRWTGNLLPPSPQGGKAFSWDQISPSTSLEYHPCFDGFQCARLEVPMDWNETTAGESDKIVIAIAKKPAKVEVTDPRYGGAILLNPGGPGGSGVGHALRYGNDMQCIVDTGSVSNGPQTISPAEERYFDLLGFDPRGTNNTTPGHGCIQDPVARQIWEAQGEALGFSMQDDDVFSSIWSRNLAYGRTCANVGAAGTANRVNENEHLGQYVSTANVVRDMVEIIERHGEWRENRAKTLLGKSCHGKENVKSTLERTMWRKGEERLQYWGFSYGTFLGQSFASMQPHRVGRMVIDGVVDADDYSLNGWTKNLNDIDSITALFATACFEAGPTRCAIYSAAGPPAILSALNSTLATLKASPLPVTYNGTPSTVTHSDVVLFIFSLWYRPYHGFQQTAHALDALARANGTHFALLKAQSATHTCDLPAPDTSSAGLAILCTDGIPRTDYTPAAHRAYLSLLRAQSPLFADHWSLVRLPCAGFSSIRAKWRFAGPFGATTAHPLLFVGQTLDPVTPLRNAFAAAELFPGSVVAETVGAGHCTLSMPSVGGMLAIRRYFRTGELPANGTRFEVDVGYFGDEEGVEGEVLRAGKRIAATWPEEE